MFMAQLKDTIISGSLRATDSLLSTTAQFKILNIPTTSNGTTYGPGTNGQVLKSNGTSVYWDSVGGGTVTSVRVQATSPVVSSTSTAQTASLNTTISLADGYGDTKNPYAAKTKNYFLAGPSSGSNAAPTFRAIAAADLPNATTSAKGGVIVGTGLYVSNGTVSIDGLDPTLSSSHAQYDRVLTKQGSWAYRINASPSINANAVTTSSAVLNEIQNISLGKPIDSQMYIGSVAIKTNTAYDSGTLCTMRPQKVADWFGLVGHSCTTSEYFNMTSIIWGKSEDGASGPYLFLADDSHFYRVHHPLKNTTYKRTVASTAWVAQSSGVTGYAYTTAIPGLRANLYDSLQVIVGLDNDNSTTYGEECDVVAAAKLRPAISYTDGFTQDSSIILWCYGTIPTIDLHITIMIVG